MNTDNRVSISREEVIPFVNPDGTIMQMANYRIAVTVDWLNQDEVQSQVDALFDAERLKLSNVVPLLKTKDKRLNFIMQKLQERLPAAEYNLILNQAKAIK